MINVSSIRFMKYNISSSRLEQTATYKLQKLECQWRKLHHQGTIPLVTFLASIKASKLCSPNNITKHAPYIFYYSATLVRHSEKLPQMTSQDHGPLQSNSFIRFEIDRAEPLFFLPCTIKYPQLSTSQIQLLVWSLSLTLEVGCSLYNNTYPKSVFYFNMFAFLTPKVNTNLYSNYYLCSITGENHSRRVFSFVYVNKSLLQLRQLTSQLNALSHGSIIINKKIDPTTQHRK